MVASRDTMRGNQDLFFGWRSGRKGSVRKLIERRKPKR